MNRALPQTCRSPPTKKWRCRLHGSASGSGGPPGERNGQYRHGERTKAAIAGAAEIQRIAENAPRWPDMKYVKSRGAWFGPALLDGRRAAHHVLSCSGWRHLRADAGYRGHNAPPDHKFKVY